MEVPTHSTAFKVLLLQAADRGRGPILFGESMARARELVPPFLVSKDFPSVYLEHPLVGDPFIDVTVLYSQLAPGTRVMSPAAGEHGSMFDWFASICEEQSSVCCGFELDTKETTLPTAAIHFQPRAATGLVRPFFESVGEPERADLYLDLASRMSEGWPLSFFGMFRGRAAAPLRVCGYMDRDESAACANDPSHLAAALDAIGFSAYDDAMLSQASMLMEAAKGTVDFQFDVFPDGSLGSTFAIDMQFGIQQPEFVWKSFESGSGARVMNLLEDWGAADERWRLAIQAAFARAVDVTLDDGGAGRFAFSLMPQWAKARWSNTALQPSKLYFLANACLLK